jgi:hypothetical protein
VRAAAAADVSSPAVKQRKMFLGCGLVELEKRYQVVAEKPGSPTERSEFRHGTFPVVQRSFQYSDAFSGVSGGSAAVNFFFVVGEKNPESGTDFFWI